MDPEHLGYLIDRYMAALVLYARQWCGAPDDVVQEAFVKLVRQTVQPDQPVAWLYRVVRNGAISQMRSSKRRQKHEAIAAEKTQTWFVLPEDPTGLDVEVVTHKLRELPLEQREVIVAHLWGGLTFEQIAEVSHSSAATCYRRYAAGLAILREKLGVPCPKTAAK
jgi:RNA polymerase sigma-70 factor (ECF subfamily)